MLHWRSFSEGGRARVSVCCDQDCGQYVENNPWCTNVNILWWIVVYLNATINVKHEIQNSRLEPTCLADPCGTHWFSGTGPGFAHSESAGWVFGWVENQTVPCLCFKPGPLAGYADPFVTLLCTRYGLSPRGSAQPTIHKADSGEEMTRIPCLKQKRPR
jgi:hypothetical protein